MERARHLIIALLLLVIAAGAAQPKVTMVLEVKGTASAWLDGRSRPLRTLQALPRDTKITVAEGGHLRLTYLQSGLKETVTGPLQLTTGPTASTAIKGTGKLAAEPSGGSTTLVPRSENLRRMGGARHAMLDMDALDLQAYIAPEKVRTHQLRFDPKPRIQDFSPSLRKLLPGREIFWIGGLEPYDVKLVRDDGKVSAEQIDSPSSALPLPNLEGGHAYTLSVVDKEGVQADPLEFYLLSDQESAETDSDLEVLAGQTREDPIAGLTAEIAYLEARGLLEEAIIKAQEATRFLPDDIGLLTVLGRLQIRLGRKAEAAITLSRAINLEAEETRR